MFICLWPPTLKSEPAPEFKSFGDEPLEIVEAEREPRGLRRLVTKGANCVTADAFGEGFFQVSAWSPSAMTMYGNGQHSRWSSRHIRKFAEHLIALCDEIEGRREAPDVRT